MNVFTNASATPRLTITSDGRIGVGTTTPSPSTVFQCIGDADFWGGDVSCGSVSVGTTNGSTVLGTLNAKYGVSLVELASQPDPV